MFAYVFCFVIALLETAAFRFLVESDNQTNRLPMASRIKQVPRFQESRAKNVASATVQVFPVFQEKIDFMWFITFTP